MIAPAVNQLRYGLRDFILAIQVSRGSKPEPKTTTATVFKLITKL